MGAKRDEGQDWNATPKLQLINHRAVIPSDIIIPMKMKAVCDFRDGNSPLIAYCTKANQFMCVFVRSQIEFN